MPVFSFGENELFNQVSNPRGSLIRRLQEGLQKAMGLALPLFHARGVFQYSFGLLPFRRPIYTVGESVCCGSWLPEGAGLVSRQGTVWIPSIVAAHGREEPLWGGFAPALGDRLSPSTLPQTGQHFSQLEASQTDLPWVMQGPAAGLCVATPSEPAPQWGSSLGLWLGGEGWRLALSPCCNVVGQGSSGA